MTHLRYSKTTWKERESKDRSKGGKREERKEIGVRVYASPCEAVCAC